MKRALVSAALTFAAVTLSSSPAWAAPSTAETTVLPGQSAYLVVPGDSFWSVSQRYGVTMADLAAWNHKSLSLPLFVGWTLQIPPADWHSPSAAAPAPALPTTSSGTTSSATYRAATTYHAPVHTSSYSGSASPSGVWACIAAHESGSNPATNTGNGYYGMYQFSMSTWQAAGGTGNPATASASQQTAVAQRVQQQQGWGAWPATARSCGA